MRLISPPRLTFGVVLVFLAGCSSNNKGQLEGTRWTSQAASRQDKTAASGVMHLEFAKDHTLVLKRGAEIHKGTYSLGIGPAVTLTFEDDYEGRKIHAEKIVVEGERLTMTNADGSQVTFQMVK